MTKPAAPAKQYPAHYISGTHWDREWYRPFPEYRLLLVRLLDELIALMETNPDFRYFQLDGQTCVLTDYLEVRPENRARLATLIRDGRILIGPWFTMPDLFCPGDESLIRNLLLGHRISHEWGVAPMPVGFICDMFGHPSQMPQLFAGFGLRDVVLGRGTNEHDTPTFFTWEGPDGTQAFIFKLQDSQGYGAFALPRATLEKPTFVLDYLKEFAAELTAAGSDAAKRAAVQEKWFKHELAKYVNHEIGRANGDVLCLMDSMDHIPPATDVARYLRLIREACPNVAPVHSNLPAFFAEARQSAHDLPVKRGELRAPSKTRNGYLWLIPNCVSARVRMKQANDAAQNLLEKWAEPLVALANLGGAGVPARFLHLAWTQVLTNHAHDSICGCSIDQVHRDMMARYEQVLVLAGQLRQQGLAALTDGAAELGQGGDEFTLLVFNPLPWARDETVTFDVDLPPDYPATFQEGFHTQVLKAFTLEDAAGAALPYQRLAYQPLTNERSRLAQFCFIGNGEFTRYTVAARLALPALGYVALRVRPSPKPVRVPGTLRTGPASAENEFLTVAIAANGTLTLTDRATGETYTDLLTFEDRSEIGDGWFHGQSLNDAPALSLASPAQIEVVHDGPELVSFRVAVTLRVPARYDWRRERPADERVELPIASVVTLRRGARVVDVETTVDNTAEDHRLQLLLPSDAAGAQTYLAHHPYDLVERRIALDATTADWQEAEIAEKPFLGLQAVGAGRRGLAFISAGGLHEGGVRDDVRRTHQITLLRSFRRTVGNAGQETDGLERGRLTYRFALLPFAGALPRGAALRELARLQAGPLLTRQSGKRPSGFPPLAGDRRGPRSFFSIEGDALALAAFKPRESGEGLVVRLWNPGDAPASAVLRAERAITAATRLMLSETLDANAPAPTVAGGAVTVTARPREIVTLALTLAPA